MGGVVGREEKCMHGCVIGEVELGWEGSESCGIWLIFKCLPDMNVFG